jgi:hypothetical protein
LPIDAQPPGRQECDTLWVQNVIICQTKSTAFGSERLVKLFTVVAPDIVNSCTTNRNTTNKQPSKGEVTNMPRKKKKTKKKIKVQDLEPREDPKGGMSQGPLKDPKLILKYLQLGQRPGGSDKI